MLRHRIEYQRPLKLRPVGACHLIPTELQASYWLPSAQRFRIYKKVNQLTVGRIGETMRRLSTQECERLNEFLVRPTNNAAKRSFDQIRDRLGLSPDMKFNVEGQKCNFLIGDQTAALIKNHWGSQWSLLSLAEQDVIISRLLEIQDPKAVLTWLIEAYGFDEQSAQKISDINFPDKFGEYSQKAITLLLPHLEAGLTYKEAVERAGLGLKTSEGDEPEHFQTLPYYGKVLKNHVAFVKSAAQKRPDTLSLEQKYGKVANPTIHIILNEIGKLINDLISHHGHAPEQIIMRLARDLPPSARGKREEEARRKRNQIQSEARRVILAQHGAQDNYTNHLKLRLFDEMLSENKMCIYSGQIITLRQLFSDEIQIDHILPFSRTLENGFGNKILCSRESLEEKGNHTPYEAFGGGSDWEHILQRASVLPRKKQMHFGPDAMVNSSGVKRDFMRSQFNEIRYVAQLVKRYVEVIYTDLNASESKNRVWVTPGRLVSDLRYFSGLDFISPAYDLGNEKLTDYRQHAVDAAVIGFIDRGLLERAMNKSNRLKKRRYPDLMKIMAEPLKSRSEPIKDKLKTVIVSHKPDHGYQGAMHNETAYGITGRRDERDQMLLVTRKPLSAFATVKQLEGIRDQALKSKFIKAVQGLSGQAFQEALQKCGEEMSPPVRRVRVLTTMKDRSFVTIGHDGNPAAKAYKGDGNYCYDVWAAEKNGKAVWTGEVITTFQAYQCARIDKDWWRKPLGRNGQRLIARLRTYDMLEISHNEKRIIVRVCQITPGKLIMAKHFESNVDARTRAGYKGDNPLKYIFKSPSTLQKTKPCLITVSPAGYVKRKALL